jgi:iron(III)-salmochelin esterase
MVMGFPVRSLNNRLRCFEMGALVVVVVCCTSQPTNNSVASNPPAPVPVAPIVKSDNGSSPHNETIAHFREMIWEYPDTGLGPTVVHLTIPETASENHRVPVLILLHGRGEALKSPEQGALGWPYDYGMLHAINRLHKPPLTPEDFGEMITSPRLAAINRRLRETPYHGVIVASPYIPDQFGRTLQRDAGNYGAFLTRTLLPRIYNELPAIGTADTTAIDGVSLGGRAAIFIGLRFPHSFGAVGGIQAALGNRQIARVTGRLETARRSNSNLLFHLMSSTKDVYLHVNQSLSATLLSRHLPHTKFIAEGNHSYEFNRGPGAYETLLHYDRILWKNQMSRF